MNILAAPFKLVKYNVKALQLMQERYGFVTSIIKRQSVDKNSEPLPWITYGAIDYIVNNIPDNLTVLEYGSGKSTEWWLNKKSANIRSIEHDQKWIAKLPDHVRVHVQLHTDRIDYVQQQGDYDIVIVDGQWRPDCFEWAWVKLQPKYIIVDDTENCNLLVLSNYTAKHFYGMGPINPWPKQTTVYERHHITKMPLWRYAHDEH